jgi:hypothetical protein
MVYGVRNVCDGAERDLHWGYFPARRRQSQVAGEKTERHLTMMAQGDSKFPRCPEV